MVGLRREKARDEIAVSEVEFDRVEPGLLGAPRRGTEVLHDLIDLGDVHRLGRRPARTRSDGARPESLPPRVDVGHFLQRQGRTAFPKRMAAGLAPRMADLHAGGSAIGMDEIDDRLQRLDVVVGPEAEVCLADAARGSDGRALDEDQAGTAERELAEMDQVPRRGTAVRGGVLHHGRDDHAVLQRQRPDRQRLEELGQGRGRHDGSRGFLQPQCVPRYAALTFGLSSSSRPDPSRVMQPVSST